MWPHAGALGARWGVAEVLGGGDKVEPVAGAARAA